jgi:hypothetical protein
VKCYSGNPCACGPFCDRVFYPRRSLAPLLGANLVVRLRSINNCDACRSFLFLETRGRPLIMVCNLLPLAMRGVESRRDHLLTIRMVSRNIEEFPSSSGSSAP